MKNGVCYYVKCKIFLQMNMQSFLYENTTNTLQANLTQVPCKMQNATMHNDAKKQMFLYFLNQNEIIKQKYDSNNPQTLQALSDNTQAKH